MRNFFLIFAKKKIEKMNKEFKKLNITNNQIHSVVKNQRKDNLLKLKHITEADLEAKFSSPTFERVGIFGYSNVGKSTIIKNILKNKNDDFIVPTNNK